MALLTVRTRFNFGICFVSFILSCIDISNRKGRVNPFDPNGDNWFPPHVAILQDSVSAAPCDTILLTVKTDDPNGNVVLLVWQSRPQIITVTDTLITSIISADCVYASAVYHFYDRHFVFDTCGIYTLYVSAIDNDGVESVFKDSVLVTVKDTSRLSLEK